MNRLLASRIRPLQKQSVCHFSSHRPENVINYVSIRYASTNTLKSSAPYKRSPFLFPGILGGAAVIAAYFFWPDTSRAAPTYTNTSLSPAHFTPVKVAASVHCSDPNTRLITLRVPPQSVPSSQDGSLSPIWSIFIKDDDIQVERPYTPLEGIDIEGNMKFWIKKYPKGEVGRWLHSKSIGDEIEIRGPLKTWPWQDGVWDEVVMISGGTGITPFYQLLHQTILTQDANASSKTRFTLLHSSKTPEELPPPEILQPIISHAKSNPEKLKVALFVDALDGSETASAPCSDLQVGRIGKQAVKHALGQDEKRTWWNTLLSLSPTSSQKIPDRKTLFLVCGPDPMIAAIAGPFGRNLSQGSVGGILGEMGYKSDQVWKL